MSRLLPQISQIFELLSQITGKGPEVPVPGVEGTNSQRKKTPTPRQHITSILDTSRRIDESPAAGYATVSEFFNRAAWNGNAVLKEIPFCNKPPSVPSRANEATPLQHAMAEFSVMQFFGQAAWTGETKLLRENSTVHQTSSNTHEAMPSEALVSDENNVSADQLFGSMSFD